MLALVERALALEQDVGDVRRRRQERGRVRRNDLVVVGLDHGVVDTRRSLPAGVQVRDEARSRLLLLARRTVGPGERAAAGEVAREREQTVERGAVVRWREADERVHLR